MELTCLYMSINRGLHVETKQGYLVIHRPMMLHDHSKCSQRSLMVVNVCDTARNIAHTRCFSVPAGPSQLNSGGAISMLQL